MSDAEKEIVAREEAAVDAWARGDTSAYAALFATDATYFDTYLPGRLQGADAVRSHLDGIGVKMRALFAARGRSAMDRHEMRHTRVQQHGDVAVLTYEWVGYLDAEAARWRASLVYRRQDGAWQVIHAHWSIVQLPPA